MEAIDFCFKIVRKSAYRDSGTQWNISIKKACLRDRIRTQDFPDTKPEH